MRGRRVEFSREVKPVTRCSREQTRGGSTRLVLASLKVGSLTLTRKGCNYNTHRRVCVAVRIAVLLALYILTHKRPQSSYYIDAKEPKSSRERLLKSFLQILDKSIVRRVYCHKIRDSLSFFLLQCTQLLRVDPRIIVRISNVNIPADTRASSNDKSAPRNIHHISMEQRPRITKSFAIQRKQGYELCC